MNYAFLSIKVVEGSTQRVQVRSLQTERHEEADTALIFYAGQFCKEDKNMVIRCDDTDVSWVSMVAACTRRLFRRPA